jgi:DNA-binding NtrC family response regulator
MVIGVVEESLRQEGYQVVSATSVEQAIETATSLAGRIALVIVNHSISGMPGRNLVEAIERLQPDVKVLRYSGYTEGHLRATGQIKPKAFFLQKPFTTQVIRKKVRDIIEPPCGMVSWPTPSRRFASIHGVNAQRGAGVICV